MNSAQYQDSIDAHHREDTTFLQAWSALKQAQQQQIQFESDFDQAVKMYSQEVIPKERSLLLLPCIALIEHLMPFLEQHNITYEQKKSLLVWLDTLIGNLSRLDDVAARRFRVKILGYIDQESHDRALLTQKTNMNHQYSVDDEVLDETAKNTVASAIDQHVNNLCITKSSWFISLFRKAAQAIHPDKEQDGQQKAKKENLMTQLILARKQGDIVQVLEFYTTFVSHNLLLSSVEMGQVIQAIQQQTQRIQCKRKKYIFQQPIRIFAYDRIYATTYQRQQYNIQNVVQEFSELRKSLLYCRARIKCTASLSSFLL